MPPGLHSAERVRILLYMGFIGTYGQTWRQGIVADHVHLAREAGWVTMPFASGHLMAVSPDGRQVEPVLCGEAVLVYTEDGPITGRCGDYVRRDGVACEGHAAELDSWRAMPEVEKAHWERTHDGA